MTCCLNPNCQSPLNEDNCKYCNSCGTRLLILKNRYRPLKNLGAGGFGRAYLAEDQDKFNELCVIKQFAPQNLDTAAFNKAEELFMREAKGLQKLGTHSQIPTLYAFFEQDKQLYLVQEYIEGKTLLEQLEEKGKFSGEEVKEILIDLLGILQFVHANQVIHRDIKPQNIIRRTNDNKLVLIDFGIAKEQTLTSLTSIGKPPTIIGTVGYAPEEQIGHTKKGVTKSSDLYGVATTCFHLLTGVNPRDSWNKYGYSWVEHWREFLADSLDPNLELVLNKLLQRNLQLRYKTAEEVLRDLKSDIDSKVNISTQVLGSNPQRITAYNAPTKVIKPKTPPQQSSLASSKYSSAKPNILSKTPVKIYPFVTSTLRQVKIWLSGSLFLLIVVGTQLYGYLRYQVFPTNPIWLFNSPPTSFFLKNTLTGHTEWVNSVAISNNDKYVVSGSGDQSIKIWNLHSGTIYSTLRGHEGSVNAVAISPNNQLISSGSDDQTIKLWQLETGQLKNNLTGHSQAINSLAFTPDGQTLVSVSEDGTVKVWNVQTGQLEKTLIGHTAGILSLAISPDGQIIATGSHDRTIKIWQLATGKLINTLPGHDSYVSALAISPDSKYIISGGADRKIKIWQLQNGTLEKTLSSHNGGVTSLAISPDGNVMISASRDNSIKVWRFNSRRLIKTFAQETNQGLTTHTGDVNSLAISQNQPIFISGSADTTIKIWKIPF